METQQRSRVLVEVAGRSLGRFETRTGGDVMAEPTKRRTGGMGWKSYGAKPDYENVVVSRVYETVRDHELLRDLRLRVGTGSAVVTEQPLDEDDNDFGIATKYIGKLVGLADGEADMQSSDARMFELTFQITAVK